MLRRRELFAWLMVVLALPAAAAFASSIPGSFALQGGAPGAQATLQMTARGTAETSQHLDFSMTRGPGEAALRSYQTELTKKLHVIIVNDDLSVFQHVHPHLLANGHFVLDERFPGPGRYHIYADATPAGLEQQVFRFDVNLGARAGEHVRTLAPAGPQVAAGPYVVTLSSTHLTVNRPERIDIHISRQGKPARDLHPYLGVAAHAVMVQADDLSYVHAHSMAEKSGGAMGGMDMGEAAPAPAAGTSGMKASVGPDSMLHIMLREPGKYRLWLQFEGADGLYVAPFVVTGTAGP